MPISASPKRGYADWQRVSNWDSGVLWAPAAGVGNVLVTSPVLDVSRFAYLGGALNTATGPCWVTFTWYVNVQQTAIVSSRNFVLSPSIGNSCQLRIPNLGPYLQIGANPVAGANFQLTGQLLGTNRVHPLEFIPAGFQLISQQAAAIGASSTVFVYPGDYYAGPIVIQYNMSQSGQFWLESLGQGGTWNTVQEWFGNNGSDFNASSVAPAGAWRFRVVNQNAAAGTYNLHITPSMTGAS